MIRAAKSPWTNLRRAAALVGRYLMLLHESAEDQKIRKPIPHN